MKKPPSDGRSRATAHHVAESIEAQRARYPLAVADVFDLESVELGNACRPSELRRCVFDSEDGLRLVVSREAGLGLAEHLHVSASLDSDCELFADARSGKLGPASFVKLALDRFHAISGDETPLEFWGLSPRGIPHWSRPMRKDAPDAKGWLIR
jgi:hypothetical protein